MTRRTSSSGRQRAEAGDSVAGHHQSIPSEPDVSDALLGSRCMLVHHHVHHASKRALSVDPFGNSGTASRIA